MSFIIGVTIVKKKLKQLTSFFCEEGIVFIGEINTT